MMRTGLRPGVKRKSPRRSLEWSLVAAAAIFPLSLAALLFALAGRHAPADSSSSPGRPSKVQEPVVQQYGPEHHNPARTESAWEPLGRLAPEQLQGWREYAVARQGKGPQWSSWERLVLITESLHQRRLAPCCPALARVRPAVPLPSSPAFPLLAGAAPWKMQTMPRSTETSLLSGKGAEWTRPCCTAFRERCRAPSWQAWAEARLCSMRVVTTRRRSFRPTQPFGGTCSGS